MRQRKEVQHWGRGRPTMKRSALREYLYHVEERTGSP